MIPSLKFSSINCFFLKFVCVCVFFPNWATVFVWKWSSLILDKLFSFYVYKPTTEWLVIVPEEWQLMEQFKLENRKWYSMEMQITQNCDPNLNFNGNLNKNYNLF